MFACVDLQNLTHLPVNPFNPKYPEWYSPSLDLEHTMQVSRGE